MLLNKGGNIVWRAKEKVREKEKVKAEIKSNS